MAGLHCEPYSGKHPTSLFSDKTELHHSIISSQYSILLASDINHPNLQDFSENYVNSRKLNQMIAA